MDIIIRDLTKCYGEKIVFKNFNAIFPEKRLTCIMGSSGCGKTTLLNMMMGLIKPDRGTISGIPRQSISAVFQEDRLCENLNALANIRFVCEKNISRATIEKHLNLVGLGESINQPVQELSGGMKRRVAIVRAMLAAKRVLFLDEPFKGLDQDTKKQLMEYVKKQIQNITAIMVTHDEKEATIMESEIIKL